MHKEDDKVIEDKIYSYNFSRKEIYKILIFFGLLNAVQGAWVWSGEWDFSYRGHHFSPSDSKSIIIGIFLVLTAITITTLVALYKSFTEHKELILRTNDLIIIKDRDYTNPMKQIFYSSIKELVPSTNKKFPALIIKYGKTLIAISEYNFRNKEEYNEFISNIALRTNLPIQDTESQKIALI